jgi:hypothetical protein
MEFRWEHPRLQIAVADFKRRFFDVATCNLKSAMLSSRFRPLQQRDLSAVICRVLRRSVQHEADVVRLARNGSVQLLFGKL